MCVKVPEQPLYFSDAERPVTERQSKSKSRRRNNDELVVADADSTSRRTSHDIGTAISDSPTTSTVKSKRRYNLRRLNELPYNLVRCRRTDQLLDEVTSPAYCLSSHITCVRCAVRPVCTRVFCRKISYNTTEAQRMGPF